MSPTSRMSPGGAARQRGPMAASQGPRSHVQMVVPSWNLQFMAFWVALAGGLFAAEGLDVDVAVAAEPLDAPIAFRAGVAEVGILPPPLYLRLIADRCPVVLCANLLRNDPLNIVLTRPVAARHGFAASLPTAEAVRRLRGLRIGVAPGPTDRLRALFAWAGIGASDVELVTLTGPEQNPAFAAGGVDGLYAHTPYLERALVDSGGVLVVHASGGGAAPVRVAQVHALVASRVFAEQAPSAVAGLVAALGAAQDLVRHRDARALEALLACGIAGLERRHLERTLEIYALAMPPMPAVTCATLRQADTFRATGSGLPAMSDAELARFVWEARQLS
jgi:ABC-type nitrate/sulfonate/bicarbonate transport system substrate-binding protein